MAQTAAYRRFGLRGFVSAVVALLCSLLASDVFALGSWTINAPMPTQRTNLGVAEVNGILYAIGGVGGSFQNQVGPLTTVEAYDPATDTWTTKAPMPLGRQDFGVGVVNGIIYVVGGSVCCPHSIGSATYAYDPTTDTWTAKAPMPTPRQDLGVGVVNGILYAVGGSGNPCGPCAIVEAYDPSTDTWTAKAPMSIPRATHGVGVLGGILYAISGFSNFQVCQPNQQDYYCFSVEAYDPVSNSWSARASIPEIVYTSGGSSVATVNGVLMATTSNSNVYSYDPGTDGWSFVTSEPAGTGGGFGTGAANGELYIIGGGFYPDFLTLNESFTPAQVTAGLGPVNVWVGLKNSDAIGIRFDLRAEVYQNGTLVGAGDIGSVAGGSSGFNNAKLDTIPLLSNPGITFLSGDTLSLKLQVRNACTGSTKNSGTARLWYNDNAANSGFTATLGAPTTVYLTNNFGLSTMPGVGPKTTVDVAAGAKCSVYKTFGTWSVTFQ